MPAALCAPASRPISLSARGRVCVLPVACLAECYTWRRRVRLPGGQLEHRRGARATRGETSAPETHSARARREPARPAHLQLLARRCTCMSARARAPLTVIPRDCCCLRFWANVLSPELPAPPCSCSVRAADGCANSGVSRSGCNGQAWGPDPAGSAILRRPPPIQTHSKQRAVLRELTASLLLVFVEPVGLYLISILPPSVHD